jgi:hypothetical protein
MRAKEYQGHGMFASCQHTDEELAKAKAALRERDERIAELENMLDIRTIEIENEEKLTDTFRKHVELLEAENARLSALVTDAECQTSCDPCEFAGTQCPSLGSQMMNERCDKFAARKEAGNE